MGLVDNIGNTLGDLGNIQATSVQNQGAIQARQVSNVANIAATKMTNIAQIQAQASAQAVQLWMNLANNIVKTVSDIPGQLQAQKRADQVTRLGDLQIQEGEAKVGALKAHEAERTAFGSALQETGGDIDSPEAQRKLMAAAPSLFPDLYKRVVDGRETAFKALDLQQKTESRQLQSMAQALDGVNDQNDWSVWTDQVKQVNPKIGAALAAQPFSPELKERTRTIGLDSKQALDANNQALQNLHQAIVNKQAGVELETKANAWVGSTLELTPREQWGEFLQSTAVQAGVPASVIAKYQAIADQPDALQRAGQMALTAQERGQAADRAADNTRQDAALAVSQGNLAVAQQREARERQQGAAGAPGGLDEAGLELAAVEKRLTGRYPARNAQQNAQILNEVARQGKLLGETPAATVQRAAAYKADEGALNQMTKAQAAAAAFESKARGEIPIILDLSGKVGRTQVPLVNEALLAGKRAIQGDSNTSQLFNALTSFTEEYAKIMTGTTGSAAGASDSARHAAKELVSAAMSKGTLADTLALMERQMDLTMRGYDVTIGHITTKMGGVPAANGGGANVTGRGGAGAPPPGARVSEVGPDGQLRPVTR